MLDAKETVAVAVHPVSGQKRITLTGNVINAAENIIFLVTGISKSTVLRQIINKETGFEKYPTSHIQPVKGKVTFYLDKAAATEIHQ